MLLNCGVGEDSWDSQDCKAIQPVNPEGNESWIFIGRTDTEAETPILWPPDGKNWLIGKDPDAGKDWGQEEKGRTEDEVVGWHHWLNGHEFEHALGVGDGQGSLVCCVQSMGSQSQSDMTERLNWTEYDFKFSSPPSLYSIFSQYCPICKIKTSSVNWFHSFFRAWANLIFRKKGFYPIPFMTFSQHLSL